MKSIIAVLGFLTFRFNCGKVIHLTSDDLLLDPLSNEFIDHINSIQNSWTAGRNFGRNTSLAYLRYLMGVKRTNFTDLSFVQTSPDATKNSLPENFDARTNWPNCPTIGEIRDQGSCGSCWALAAVEAMSDRVCIHSNGTKNFYFSAQNVVACCRHCDITDGNGCKGGNPIIAWFFWKDIGIVSGGGYGSNSGCAPYEYSPCEHRECNVNGNLPQCRSISTTAPVCKSKCAKGYKIRYIKDLHRGKSVYAIENDADKVMREIYTNGPVEAEYDVYEDFIHYKTGIYEKVIGNHIGRHATRILGWGVENGKHYWLAANSWNSGWGDNGFFKIRRGSNECGIENKISSGIPEGWKMYTSLLVL